MPVWKHRIQLKDVLGDDDSPEGTRAAARVMHVRLERALATAPLSSDEFDPLELAGISDEFHSLGFVDHSPSVHDFNAAMNALYDWADAVRVWVA